jgi:hypothetical protein
MVERVRIRQGESFGEELNNMAIINLELFLSPWQFNGVASNFPPKSRAGLNRFIPFPKSPSNEASVTFWFLEPASQRLRCSSSGWRSPP